MRINKIEIANFYSFKQDTIDFDQYSGLVCIEGINKDSKGSNGAGKSVIIEAVVWSLFGRTIRKSTEESLVNNQAKKKCEVSIHIEGGTVITRSKRPTVLRFIYRGEDRTQNNVLNTQKEIERLLNIDYKTFLAACVFGQQNNVDFVSASSDDKRLIIKNFLNLDSIFGLRDSVKFLKSEYSQSRKGKLAVSQAIQKQLDEAKAKLKEALGIKEEAESKYSHEVLSSSVEKIAQTNKEIYAKELSIEKDKTNVEKFRKKLDTPISTSCKECGQPIAVNTTKILENVCTYNKEIAYLKKRIEEETIILSRLRQNTLDMSELHVITKYQELCNRIEYFEESLLDLSEKYNECMEECSKLEKDYEIMRFWEKAFSESGVVKYVIRNILGFLNSRLDYYLSYLTQNQIAVTFDEELKETITNNGREAFHDSLSGGERKRVNLAVMLALQNLLSLSNNEEGNLLFFDEVATFVDEEGIDGLYILLQEMKKGKTLFIISHDFYLKSLLSDAKTLTVIKEKGFSKIR